MKVGSRDREQAAAHEAGHLIVYATENPPDLLWSMRIARDPNNESYVRHDNKVPIKCLPLVIAGGLVSEYVFLDRIQVGVQKDIAWLKTYRGDFQTYYTSRFDRRASEDERYLADMLGVPVCLIVEVVERLLPNRRVWVAIDLAIQLGRIQFNRAHVRPLAKLVKRLG